jgi:hypothetical protein
MSVAKAPVARHELELSVPRSRVVTGADIEIPLSHGPLMEWVPAP